MYINVLKEVSMNKKETKMVEVAPGSFMTRGAVNAEKTGRFFRLGKRKTKEVGGVIADGLRVAAGALEDATTPDGPNVTEEDSKNKPPQLVKEAGGLFNKIFGGN